MIRRIYQHLASNYGIGSGSVVVDPFGGVALGALGALQIGAIWRGVELEPRFRELAQANLDKWATFYPNGDASIVQGDSRQLCAILGGQADCIVSSPPYSETALSGGVPKTGQGLTQGKRCIDDYGDTPGQLGGMKAGDVDAVVTSPPWEKNCEGGFREGKFKDPRDALQAGRGHGASDEARLRQLKRDEQKTYGDSPGQLKHTEGETFWSAAREIVQQCHAILKPGGVAVWVLKDFVRAGKRVPFSDDWRRLCEACGFQMVEWIQASLVKEERHPSLFGGEEVRTVERKSFFRRLCESKGSPRIDHEDVLIMRTKSA